jgi:hypothetical protein
MLGIILATLLVVWLLGLVDSYTRRVHPHPAGSGIDHLDH